MLIVTIHDWLGGLPLAAVVEVVRPMPIEPIANAPEFVLGLSMVRGQPLPVVDLMHLLSGRPGRPSRFVVIRVADRRVALAVDSVVGIRDVPPAEVRQLPPLLQAGGGSGIAGLGTLDAELLMVLSAAHLVPRGLLESIAEVA